MTKLICIRTFNCRTIDSVEHSSICSEQSPPCSKKAWPRAAESICNFKSSTSQLVTNGGKLLSLLTAFSSAAALGYSGCCFAIRARQDAVDQFIDGTCCCCMRIKYPGDPATNTRATPRPTFEFLPEITFLQVRLIRLGDLAKRHLPQSSKPDRGHKT